jgi:nitrogen-specific signal transduction histidine kinase
MCLPQPFRPCPQGQDRLFHQRQRSRHPLEIRDKIFDPFFTTKDVGQGMGLGLSICNRIIADHGGRVEVRSQPGLFTEFILEFPTADSLNNHQADN